MESVADRAYREKCLAVQKDYDNLVNKDNLKEDISNEPDLDENGYVDDAVRKVCCKHNICRRQFIEMYNEKFDLPKIQESLPSSVVVKTTLSEGFDIKNKPTWRLVEDNISKRLTEMYHKEAKSFDYCYDYDDRKDTVDVHVTNIKW